MAKENVNIFYIGTYYVYVNKHMHIFLLFCQYF